LIILVDQTLLVRMLWGGETLCKSAGAVIKDIQQNACFC
jgi:hypothetical protein